MSIMYESSKYFVRIKNKGGHLKITIWDNTGDKLLSDFLGPDPAVQFWNNIESLTDDVLTNELKAKVDSL